MLIFFIIVILLIVMRFALPASTPPIRRKGNARSSKGIAVLEKIRIGGSDQWILERSENTDNPIVLYLHGGPGTSQLTSNRRDTRDLEKYFVVVNWDQRGAGKSYNAIQEIDKMNIDQFVQDARELTLYLMKKFNKKRIILVGHSWGSAIGALAVSKYPELYYCYVGISQIANSEEGEQASFRWTLEQARERNHKRTVAKLENFGLPPYQGDWQKKTMTQRMFLGRFGGEFHSSKNGAFGYVIKSILFSREYGFMDRINYFKGILASMKLLWPQLLKVDLFESVPEFIVPVYFMEGRFDHEVPSEITERYFDAIKAPSKELIWFDKSAHMPNAEERDLFNNLMVKKVLPNVTQWVRSQ